MSFLVNSPTLENLVVLSLLSNPALKSSISIALFPIDWKKSVIGLFANNISLDTNSPFTLTAISLTLSKSGYTLTSAVLCISAIASKFAGSVLVITASGSLLSISKSLNLSKPATWDNDFTVSPQVSIGIRDFKAY